MLFLDLLAFVLVCGKDSCRIGPGVARGLAGAFLAGGCALEGREGEFSA